MLISEAIEQYVRYKEGLGEKPRVKKYVLLSFGKHVGLEKPCARDPRSPVPLTLAVQNSLTL